MSIERICVSSLTCIVILSSPLLFASYGGGSGTVDDPYQIWTPQQMNAIGLNPGDWNMHFKLMADIDMSIYTGTQYNIIGYGSPTDTSFNPFRGSFDGYGHNHL
jgi:hypothetical protein